MQPGRQENLRLNTFLSIMRTSDFLNRCLEIELGKRGYTRARFRVMHALALSEGKLTPTVLSHQVFRSKHSVTSVIKGLERMGAVVREDNPEDDRSFYVVLTENGRRSIAEALSAVSESTDSALSSLDPERMEEVTAILSDIRRHVYGQMGWPAAGRRARGPDRPREERR